jgi:tripartite-type tricarboxylate transporter receptor subunit TctC
MKRLCSVLPAVALALSGFLGTSPAGAAAFPEKAINVILPFAPGGGTDILTRVFDIFAKDVFGHNFDVVYQPGGGSAVGTTAIAHARNDGYTIGMGSLPHMFLQPASGAGRYSLDDFEYIALIASEPQIMVTPKSSPYKTYAELKAASQKEPGKMTLGIPSPLSETWLAYKILDEKEHYGFTMITYQGGAEMNAALLGNHVDAAMANIAPVYGEIHNLKVFGVTSPERISFLPDVPTFKELGVDVTSSVERVFMVPKGVPEDRVQVLREGFKKIWHNPDFQKRCAELRYGLKWIDGDKVRPYLDQNKTRILEIYEKSKTEKK